MKLIFDNLQTNKLLKIIKYNKKLQNILNININDYVGYLKTEIEIIPIKTSKKLNFINIQNNDEKCYYTIYFNDNKKTINRTYLTPNDKVKKIKIIIDYEVKKFNELFKNCECIKKITFSKFNRKDINDMSLMFFGCT